MTTSPLTRRVAPLVRFSIRKPKLVLWVTLLATIAIGLLSLGISVDTDPENMLASDHEVRVRNAELRETFDGHQMIVAGITVDAGDTVVTADRLNAVLALNDAVGNLDGVLADHLVSVATAADGTLADDAAAAELADGIAQDPLLGGTVISADGRTAALFIAIDSKDVADDISGEVKDLVAADPVLADADVNIAGLPLAQDAFGSQMFVQMGIFAPLAGLLVFALMLLFFRRLELVTPAMLLALVTVIVTMGLLIGTGNTVHIMSSMIPIFLMPTAILDSIHVLSEFYDRYPTIHDRKRTIEAVYDELIRPVTFTTLTTIAGFASLALAPIPPVRVFGIFVAVGMAIAWLLSLTFLPAFIMNLNEDKLRARLTVPEHCQKTRLGSFLDHLGRATLRLRTPILVAFVLLAVAAIPGIMKIDVNDNPVRWFKSGTEIRESSEALNDALPGTFGANLVLNAEDPSLLTSPETIDVVHQLEDLWSASGIVGSAGTYVDLIGPATGDDAAAALTEARAGSNLVATLVTEDLTAANLRLQLNNGDNQAMREVVDETDALLAASPLPAGVTAEWAGEAYLNMVWQDEMVSGMLEAFISTLVVVLLLLVVLFRSIKWALLAMLPVAWTVLGVYGLIGYVGKDYDMPIAVLSTLVIGIGVDFAIHYVERFRELYDATGSTSAALAGFFEEPARALTRNALIVALGFTPLFLSSLVPYLVVGAFLSGILLTSWLTTIVVLPAVTSFIHRREEAADDTVVDLTSAQLVGTP
ncbi:MAG: MMPL family transporter [Acidimicrobiales bacterium]|nr:MMPL family transporter [Acidimicrobiales bacterium]